MGKKKSGGHREEEEAEKGREFVLKVAMHCNCYGCTDKIRAAVNDITRLQGIETWDQSALESKGELRLVATADPEKLRQRLHKATRKHVDLLLPPSKNKDVPSKNKDSKAGADAAAAQALLLNSLQGHHLPQYGQNAWANQLLAGGGGWNAHGSYAQAAYPWAAVQQQPDPYAAYSSGAWGAYPPAVHQGHGGAYYGGAWHGGHGY